MKSNIRFNTNVIIHAFDDRAGVALFVENNDNTLFFTWECLVVLQALISGYDSQCCDAHAQALIEELFEKRLVEAV